MADLHEAHDRYADLEARLAEGFLLTFEQVAERSAAFLRSGIPVEGFEGIRRARVRRFPFGVFYRFAEPDDLRVLQVLHERRASQSIG